MLTFEDRMIDILENGTDNFDDNICARDFAVMCIKLFKEISKCTKLAEHQIVSQMQISELKTILNDYNDDDIVQLRIYGMSDYPTTELVVADDVIMKKEY